MKTVILYQSFTGNTEKVTRTIENTLKNQGIIPETKKVSKELDINLYDYDLVFLGTPVIQFLPCKPVCDFIRYQLSIHRKKGNIIPCSPKLPGKYAVCYVTYSGPHTGIREAIGANKYMEQFFEHLRFLVLGEWYIIGEFHKNEELSTKGVLGNIKGRPTKEDLIEIEVKVKNVINKIKRLSKKDYTPQEEFIPGAMRFMKTNQEFFNKFKELREAQTYTSSLDKTTQELIKIALSANYKCHDCLKYHILEALNNGVTEIEIRDALFCGAIIGGPPFLSFAFEVLDELNLI